MVIPAGIAGRGALTGPCVAHDTYSSSGTNPTDCHWSGHWAGFVGSRKNGGSPLVAVTNLYFRHVEPSMGPMATVQPAPRKRLTAAARIAWAAMSSLAA